MCGRAKNDLKSLLTSIEDLREELHDSVRQGRNTLDPLVLKLSQDLDEKLNRYYQITLKTSNR